MKKVKLQKKLMLQKETIIRLNDEQMDNVQGGATTNTVGTRCSNLSPCYSITICSQCPSGPTQCTGALSGCTVCNNE